MYVRAYFSGRNAATPGIKHLEERIMGDKSLLPPRHNDRISVTVRTHYRQIYYCVPGHIFKEHPVNIGRADTKFPGTLRVL